MTTVRKTRLTFLNLVLLFAGWLTSCTDTGLFPRKGQQRPRSTEPTIVISIQWSQPSWNETIHPTCIGWRNERRVGVKQIRKPNAGNLHAGFDEAGTGNQVTVRLLRHSQRKRRATARPHLRSMAPVLDPTSSPGSGVAWRLQKTRFSDPWRIRVSSSGGPIG